MMNTFSYLTISSFIACFILTIIILRFGRAKAAIHIVWASFVVAVGVWELGAFFVSISKTQTDALFWWRVNHIGIIFIPVSLFHVIYLLCGLKRKRILILVYLQALVFLILDFSSKSFISGVRYVFSSFYYGSLGNSYHVFFIFWLVIVVYSHIELFLAYFKSKGLKKTQLKYFIIFNLAGFSGGLTNFLPAYHIDLYPYGSISTPIYCIISTYAILRYRLLDINVAITRTGIFVAVYSLVLGLPFVFAYSQQSLLIRLFGDNWWIAPLVLSTVLATAGPFIYLYIQHRAEDRLLREQRRYQATLRQASVGMTRIRDLNKLLNLIVHIITRTVRLKHSSIYLLNKRTNQFELRAIRDKGRLKGGFSPPSSRNGIGTAEGFAQEYQPYGLNFNSNSALVWNLILEKEPLVYEEVKQKMQDYKDEKLALLEQELRMIDAAVVVPSFVEEKLLGFIVLGEKLSGKIYSQDDLSVFSVLANQSALAIENAEFYEDIKETQTQLFHAEKMATIGTMADGLSHQINNRFHALGMISADALDALKSINESSTPEQIREVYAHLNHAFERVIENVKQGGEVVHSLLKYSRAGEAGFEPVDLDTLLDSSLEMVQYKVKLSQIDFFRDYPKDLPKIKGNFTQLQEVFFNFIDNAYDAINQRKNELNEPDYRGNVTIQAAAQDSKIQIRFIDNGMGVKAAEKERLFTPFFTTKTSSKKGTGLGLYVIQKIIVDNHKGKIYVESEYKTGTMFTIELPIA